MSGTHRASESRKPTMPSSPSSPIVVKAHSVVIRKFISRRTPVLVELDNANIQPLSIATDNDTRACDLLDRTSPPSDSNKCNPDSRPEPHSFPRPFGRRVLSI